MKKVIATAILLFVWINATFAEVWGTITRSIKPMPINAEVTTTKESFDFKKYNTAEEFIKAEGQTCEAATDGCNTIMIWNGQLGGSTMMMCYGKDGEAFKPQYSCIKEKGKLSQNDQNLYDHLKSGFSKKNLAQLDKVISAYDKSLSNLSEEKKLEKINQKLDLVWEKIMKIVMSHPQDIALPKKESQRYNVLKYIELSLELLK